jgi:hypothetical protein
MLGFSAAVQSGAATHSRRAVRSGFIGAKDDMDNGWSKGLDCPAMFLRQGDPVAGVKSRFKGVFMFPGLTRAAVSG